jgi:exosortase
MQTTSNPNVPPDPANPLSRENPGTGGHGYTTGRPPLSPATWLLALIPLAYLWFRLIDNLLPEWNTNPQYGYGLLVPFLCLGLIIRRWVTFTASHSPLPAPGSPLRATQSHWFLFWFSILLAVLYLPTRLVEAATPEWRPIQWALGIVAIGLTLCAIDAGGGRGWLRQLAFPICFFFVAIPWPTLFEAPIIQSLTRIGAAMVVELLGWVDVPALVHGNVIEVSTGMVGIDEACSGIRSFQSSLMISLFLGEFYRLSTRNRWLLVPTGFVLSMAFNVCRMFLLTLVAAKKGVPAISKYHDPAGVTIAILCTLALWGLAWVLARREKRKQRPNLGSQLRTPNSPLPSPFSSFPDLSRFGLFLLVWLVVVEAGVQTWYRIREAHLKPGLAWTLVLPKNNPSLKMLTLDDSTRNLLRYDEAKSAAWSEPDGTQWQAYYFNWKPGRVAGYLAKRHTPEICLTASGITLLSGPTLSMMQVHGVNLPIRSYVFQTENGIFQVFHCRWEAGAAESAYVTHESGRYNLVRAIWAGRGNKGQKVLEIIISGQDDSAKAKVLLKQELEKLIQVEKSKSASAK